MIINLNATNRIVSDGNGYVFEQLKIATEKSKTPGLGTWMFNGHYPNLEWAVKAIVKKSIETNEIEGIKEIISAIEKATEQIVSKIRIYVPVKKVNDNMDGQEMD